MNGLRRNDAATGTEAGITQQPRVAIVILNWNGLHFLQQFLPQVLASGYANKQVIVADNASTDESVAYLRTHFPEVEILRNSSNEGFAKGYHTALQQVQADYFVLLNSDVEVTPGWIEPVIALMENDALIAACQPKVLSFYRRNEFEYAGACGGWIDRLGYPFARGRVFDITETDRGQYDDAAPCFWATGAALFIKAEAYEAVGGLDGFFFAHQEEIDLCWRLQHAGYKVYVQPASVVYHVGGGTLAKDNHFKTYLNFRNNLVMMAKNLPMPGGIPLLIFRLMLDGVAAWRELAAGHPAFFKAVCKSHVHFVKWLVFQQRASVFPKVKKRGLLPGCYGGAVVWQHFVKGKNSFSEIVP